MSEVSTGVYADLQGRHEFDVYPKRRVALVRGRGATVFDAEGRAYLDAAAAFGVSSVGHANDAVVAAIARQSERLLACPGTFYCDARATLLEKLAEIAPGHLERSYLCNSGTEAVEAAIKFARFATGRPGIVCAMRGFHGRTLGALSATWAPRAEQAFGPLVPRFTHVPYNDLGALEASVDAQTAAVLLEVVQGEGGVHIGSRAYLRGAQVACRRAGAMFILDEVQTGFCRTGRMFAAMHHDLEPDIMCLAKGIAGGLPLGATMCAGGLEPPRGQHGSTFAGSPLACAAAVAAIQVMQSECLEERAEARGARLETALARAALPRVRARRRLGLMVGLELKEKVRPVLERLLQRGVIALPAGTTVLRLLPPLVITEEEIDRLAERLVEVLSSPG